MNQAFIDGQNLYMGTNEAEKPWRVNLKRFRVYLREKYMVEIAYYFIGYYIDTQADLYRDIQETKTVANKKRDHLRYLSARVARIVM